MESRRSGQFLQRLADPALGQLFGSAGGLPDVHGPEVRLIGVGIADALNDAQLALVVQLRQLAETRMQRKIVGDFLDGSDWLFERWAELHVLGVLERDDSVDP